MKSKTIVRDLMVGLFLALCGFTATRLAVQTSRVQAQTSVLPFTLQLDFYRYPDRAAPVLYAREVTARRQDGTTVTKRTIGPVRSNLWFRKITHIDGEEVLVHDVIGEKTTIRRTPKEVSDRKNRLLNPPGNCLYEGFKLIRSDLVLGHRVAVVQEDRSDSRTTRWLAEDLGCEQVTYTGETRDTNNQWRVDVGAQAVNLQLGQPDPKLFEIDKPLKEVKPSEAIRAYHALLGLQEGEMSRSSTEALDREYMRQTEQR